MSPPRRSGRGLPDRNRGAASRARPRAVSSSSMPRPTSAASATHRPGPHGLSGEPREGPGATLDDQRSMIGCEVMSRARLAIVSRISRHCSRAVARPAGRASRPPADGDDEVDSDPRTVGRPTALARCPFLATKKSPARRSVRPMIRFRRVSSRSGVPAGTAAVRTLQSGHWGYGRRRASLRRPRRLGVRTGRSSASRAGGCGPGLGHLGDPIDHAAAESRRKDLRHPVDPVGCRGHRRHHRPRTQHAPTSLRHARRGAAAVSHAWSPLTARHRRSHGQRSHAARTVTPGSPTATISSSCADTSSSTSGPPSRHARSPFVRGWTEYSHARPCPLRGRRPAGVQNHDQSASVRRVNNCLLRPITGNTTLRREGQRADQSPRNRT